MPYSPTNTARQSMVREQLFARGIDDPRVIRAFERVPRERFVPDERRAAAYSDQALPIECQQTISQPYIVGLMTAALALQGNEHVLEIGTGSGYQTAVLCELASDVVSVERHAALSATAGQTLSELGYQNFTLVVGDGSQGYPPLAPYDHILVTAAARGIPPALWRQLNENGLLIIPLGEAESQSLQAIRKWNGQPAARELCPCRFVPLIGESGWSP